MNWIIRKKIYQPLEFICSILLNIFNITIVAVVIDLLWRIWKVSGANWYEEAVTKYSDTDIFYQEKTDILLYTMVGVAVVVLGYSMYTMWMFWLQQRRRLDTQLGVFQVQGHTKKHLWMMLCGDVLFDEVLALFICYGIYQVYMCIGSKSELWASLYRLSGGIGAQSIVVLLISALIYALMAMVFHQYWVRMAEKKGAAALLRGK